MQENEPADLYRLLSNDGNLFRIDRDTIGMIERVENLFINAGLDHIDVDDVQPIKLDISGMVMWKMLTWCEQHKHDRYLPADDNEDTDPEHIPDWDLEFLTVRHNLLFDLIRASRDYGVPGLFDMCCRVVGRNPMELLAGLMEENDDDDGVEVEAAAAA